MALQLMALHNVQYRSRHTRNHRASWSL